ncbi:chitooligosaccharide deacetylase NodB [Mesorhizobium hawassense]|uniref:Chitooligosaccharide deacetylase n=1 Tax=Mesorhizobium hawassense TaxID=1209954 RepID=A0A330HDC4_9HYPH|nr:chitooligosaccharide deacetylase NodB [Mesorhizobium hawassense]RAZ85618.1 chitooligosaccharide deacetylase NodB [Mesorhizobium hawassense]
MTHLDYMSEVPDECSDRTSSVYLTFDDGPNPAFTSQILDVLAQHQVPATFFVIGAYAVGQPELIRRMVAEGHETANHTMTHRDLSRCEPGEVKREVLEANRVIKRACPRASVRRFRAPYGNWTEEALAVLGAAGLTAVHWSVDPRDWSRPGVDAIVDSVLTSVRPGAIILLHDGCPPDEMIPGTHASQRDQTVTALCRLIPALHGLGFTIRALPQPH